MKKYAARHESEIRTFTKLEYEKIMEIEHLFEFDRYVQ
jgi:hypothetical protein